jgi:hypothetical protein
MPKNEDEKPRPSSRWTPSSIASALIGLAVAATILVPINIFLIRFALGQL